MSSGGPLVVPDVVARALIRGSGLLCCILANHLAARNELISTVSFLRCQSGPVRILLCFCVLCVLCVVGVVLVFVVAVCLFCF